MHLYHSLERHCNLTTKYWKDYLSTKRNPRQRVPYVLT